MTVSKVVLPIVIYDDPNFDDESTVFTEWSVTPYIPAKLSGPPEDCYPEECAEVEFIRAWMTMPDARRKVVEYGLIEVHIKEQLSDAEVLEVVLERQLDLYDYEEYEAGGRL